MKELVNGRITKTHFLYDKFPHHLYTENKNMAWIETISEQNEQLLNELINDPDIIHKRYTRFINEKPYKKDLYVKAENAFYTDESLQTEYKRRLYVNTILNKYMYNMMNEYHFNTNILYCLTHTCIEERFNEQIKDTELVLTYNTTAPDKYNLSASEPFVKTLIEKIFYNIPEFAGYTLKNYQSEPEGQKQCPDHGWEIYDPNGKYYCMLYIEVKATLTPFCKSGKLSTPKFHNAGKEADSIEECLLPVINCNKHTKQWQINPCFSTFVIFVLYCVESTYIDNVEVSALQYYMSVPSLFQLSLRYAPKKSEKHYTVKDNISFSFKKFPSNMNVIISPCLHEKYAKQYKSTYEFMKHNGLC